MIIRFAIIFSLLIFSNVLLGNGHADEWSVSIIPSSVRVDPVTSSIIEERFSPVPAEWTYKDLLTGNWIFNGESATLYSGRGEYISFQLVITNHSEVVLESIVVEMEPFKLVNEQSLGIKPELFLEWSVQVKTPSGGYPESSLGKGWYPDALIPFDFIQVNEPSRRWIYPLQIPDFNNRIDNQKSLIVWVDQFIPFERDDALPGIYFSMITVKADGQQKSIPIHLTVWDFEIPNQNRYRASLQHEGFLSGTDEERELEIYQLLKRHRISVMDPTYKPDITVSDGGEVRIDWETFDKRLGKYFTGKAFTEEYGYAFGPGYGEPVENFLLPFDVYGKHDTRGWPDIGNPKEEMNPANQKVYIETIKQFRSHLLRYIDPVKTMLTVYLNGLDESYFPEAWTRMAHYGNVFKKYFPESYFRIDGSYGEEAMKIVKPSISAWGAHTINYNNDEVRDIREAGIKDWVYGSLIYESKVNSWVGSSTYIDLPLVNERALSWTTYKYGTYSWISWGIGAGWNAAWYDPETWKDYRDDRDERQEQKILNGNGCLIYAPNILPNVPVVCPSVRLKNIRNGIQEYEYLKLLENVDAEMAKNLAASLINKPFGREAIGVIDVWSFNAEEWDKQRIKMGEILHKKLNQ